MLKLKYALAAGLAAVLGGQASAQVSFTPTPGGVGITGPAGNTVTLGSGGVGVIPSGSFSAPGYSSGFDNSGYYAPSAGYYAPSTSFYTPGYSSGYYAPSTSYYTPGYSSSFYTPSASYYAPSTSFYTPGYSSGYSYQSGSFYAPSSNFYYPGSAVSNWAYPSSSNVWGYMNTARTVRRLFR